MGRGVVASVAGADDVGVGKRCNFGGFWGHAIAAILALSFPVALAFLAHQLVRLLNPTFKPRPFITLAYGYLPLVLFSNLAHYLQMGLTEAGQVIPLSLATIVQPVGASASLVWMAHPAVIVFLQGACLIAGAILSSSLIQKIARQPLLKLLPQHLAVLVFTVLTWQLVL